MVTTNSKNGKILGVLTGQVPVHSAPIAMKRPRQELDGEWIEDGSE